MSQQTKGTRPGKRAISQASGVGLDFGNLTHDDDDDDGDDETRGSQLEALQRALQLTLEGSAYQQADPRRANVGNHFSAGRELIAAVKDVINREVLAMDYVQFALSKGRVWDAEDLCRMGVFVHDHALFWVVFEIARALKTRATEARAAELGNAAYLEGRTKWYFATLRQIALRVTDKNSAPGSRIECLNAICDLTGSSDDEHHRVKAMLDPKAVSAPDDKRTATA